MRDFPLPKYAPIIDVGGGASTLPGDLLSEGFEDITVLDISRQALKESQKKLGDRASKLHWIEGDIMQASLAKQHYLLWHDRAVFHFLTEATDRVKYVELLKRSIAPKGYLIISTFSLGGPEKCSGLNIVRYNEITLAAEIGSDFCLLKSFSEEHRTPFNTIQKFVYCAFQKK